MATRMTTATAEAVPAEPSRMVPFPAEFPPDPEDRDEMIALMHREWDEHLARVTELYRKAHDKQARSRGSICWSGFRDFCREAQLPVPGELPRHAYGKTGPAPEMTIPDGGYKVADYGWFTPEGLSAIRAARITAWTRQMAAVRVAVMRYHENGYITLATVTKTFAEAGLAAPATVVTASFSGSMQLPGEAPASSELAKVIREAVEAAFPGIDLGIKPRGGIRVSTSKVLK